jgi:hypothetical protein
MLVIEGLQQRYGNLLTKMLKQNALAIADFMIDMNTEINSSDNHKMNIIDALDRVSDFYDNKKPFKEMTRENILSFLDSFRKAEISDPQHKWIGTYNLYRAMIVKFFKWLYYPNIESSKRPKVSIIRNNGCLEQS